MDKGQKNRFSIVVFILVLMMAILVVQLFNLTIVNGDYYTEIAENKRVKEIYVSAPRGNIYDRNGNLLAGTKTSFSVQLMKDEINTLDVKTRNENFLKLVRYLEESGAAYMEDYPIGLNVFEYSQVEEYFSQEETPDEKIINIIIENNLLQEFLRASYIDTSIPNHYRFYVVNRAINAIKGKGINIPISTDYKNGFRIQFQPGENFDKFSKEHNVSATSDPYEVVAKLIDKDESLIRKIIDHPLSRLLIYEIIKDRSLEGTIKLSSYALAGDKNFVINKAKLNNSYPSITLDSDVKDDFVTIVTESSLKQLLDKIDVQTGGTFFLPAQYLIDMLENKGIDTNLSAKINEKQDGVDIDFVDEDPSDEVPLDALINLAEVNDVLHAFITDDNIKFLAQESNTENGINPRISVANWQYTYINEKNNLIEGYKIDFTSTPEEVFLKGKEIRKIEAESRYEAIGIMSLYSQLAKQGSYGYRPLNIAYGLSESAVSKIAENLPLDSGISVAAIPIRYYPEGNLAAHILGYLGRISQPEEIKKYTAEEGYASEDLIGKTGVEESFETTLKGKDGKKRVEVDSLGYTTNILSEEASVPGNNLYLTLDMGTQKVMEESLKKTLSRLRTGAVYDSDWGDYVLSGTYPNAKSGASVAINVKTGAIIASASEPSYDPNLFATGISNSDWDNLMPDNEKDPLAPRPLLNMAIQSAIQPGSIFKLATSLAALEKGLDPTDEILDSGFIEIGDTTFACWLWNQSKGTHGYENLYEALRDSCNYYYYVLALGKDPNSSSDPGIQLNVEDIIATSTALGLNQKTGIEINIPAETIGDIPSVDAKLSATKSRLANYLRSNIRKYIKPGLEKSPEKIEDDIDTIASWVEEATLPSRTEVITRIENLGYNAQVVFQNERASLADAVKYNYLNQAAWNISDTLNVVIGQGQNAYTPLQMANYMSIFANGGYRNKATVVESIKSYDDEKIIYQNEPERTQIELTDMNNLKEVSKGLNMAANYGSNQLVMGKLPIQVAVKTGTAEREGVNPVTGRPYDNYSWYIAYAPYDDPQIAVATVLVQGGSGSNGAPMTQAIIAEYLNLIPGEDLKDDPAVMSTTREE